MKVIALIVNAYIMMVKLAKNTKFQIKETKTILSLRNMLKGLNLKVVLFVLIGLKKFKVVTK